MTQVTISKEDFILSTNKIQVYINGLNEGLTFKELKELYNITWDTFWCICILYKLGNTAEQIHNIYKDFYFEVIVTGK